MNDKTDKNIPKRVLIFKKMDKKQTAVEWLISELQRLPLEHRMEKSHLFYHAKQMEKEQSITDYKHGQNNGYMYRDGNGELIQAEQYYNETYKGGEQ